MMIPINTDFKTWANSLVIDYPRDNIPLYNDGMDWKFFGNLLASENSFSSQDAPTTEGFSDSMKWAMSVYKAMVNS